MSRPFRVFFIFLGLAWCLACRVAFAEEQPVLRVQGSNTIGAELGPALVEGLMRQKGLVNVHAESAGKSNEVRVYGTNAIGQRVRIDVGAHGSATGFAALRTGSADLAAASRPIKDAEVRELASLGDLRSHEAEQVIAIDGVAVILQPSNPLRELTIEQLARIFSGEVRDWRDIGGNAGPIHLYARDEQSGTWETFKELVLTRYGKRLASDAQRFESSEALSDAVSQDRNGIGFIGLPYIHQARPVAVIDGDASAMLPTLNLIATEDYPLSRRLYFYLPPNRSNPWARDLAVYAQSAVGQEQVARSGFVAQTVRAVNVAVTAQMPPAYQALARQAKRLSVNFRFAQGSANLDSKARQDLQRVVDYLRSHGKLDGQVTLVGFGDAKSDPDRAALLSRLRAMAVRRELLKSNVTFREISGYGDEMPVATNEVDEGRIRNRRVEVWVN